MVEAWKLLPVLLASGALAGCASELARPQGVASAPAIHLACEAYPGKVQVEISDRWSLTPLGLAILIFTGSWASHADFVTCEDRLVGATPFGGLRERRWSRPHRYERFFVTADARAMEVSLQAQMGKPYNWGVFLAYPTGIKMFSTGGAAACSQIVQAEFLKVGADLSGKPDWETSPADLLKSPLLQPARPCDGAGGCSRQAQALIRDERGAAVNAPLN